MLAEILHKLIEEEGKEQGSVPYYPRPSLAGPQRCIRSLDYDAQGVQPAPFPGRALTVMEDSSFHEDLIKDKMRKSAWKLHSEQMKVNCGKVNGKNITGKMDGIITDILGIDRVLEIKALSHFGFQAIWAGEMPLDYIYQTVHYVYGAQESNPEIKEALLFIKNKNQAQYLDILIHYDRAKDEASLIKMTLSTGEIQDLDLTIPNVIQTSCKRFEEIEQYRKDGKLHPRQYTFDNWHCEYCRFGQKCWEGWEQEIQAISDTLEANELIEDCQKLTDINTIIKNYTANKEMIEDRLKTAIRDKARHGKAGSYIWGLRPQYRSYVDMKKLPPELVAAASEKKMSLVFEAPKALKIKKEK